MSVQGTHYRFRDCTLETTAGATWPVPDGTWAVTEAGKLQSVAVFMGMKQKDVTRASWNLAKLAGTATPA